ncbi:hypothetical protein P7K49_009121, partial [Saguinus oedipus]
TSWKSPSLLLFLLELSPSTDGDIAAWALALSPIQLALLNTAVTSQRRELRPRGK